MNWPQITLITILALSSGIVLARHGQPREGVYNIWYDLLGTGLIVWLLFKGGFFGA